MWSNVLEPLCTGPYPKTQCYFDLDHHPWPIGQMLGGPFPPTFFSYLLACFQGRQMLFVHCHITCLFVRPFMSSYLNLMIPFLLVWWFCTFIVFVFYTATVFQFSALPLLTPYQCRCVHICLSSMCVFNSRCIAKTLIQVFRSVISKKNCKIADFRLSIQVMQHGIGISLSKLILC